MEFGEVYVKAGQHGECLLFRPIALRRLVVDGDPLARE
jgi:hypothetical protein